MVYGRGLMRRVLPLVVLAVGAALLVLGGRDGAAPAQETAGRVVRVVDGDTVRVRLGGRDEPVRYIGIDTPEAARAAAGDCYAGRATRANARLVAGRRVRLVFDVERRDRFGRLLAYVYRAADDRFVNGALVRGGYARTLTIEPNVRFAARFAALAAAARRDGRGLWSACAAAYVASRPVAMRMRQSLSQLERAFVEEAQADRERRERQLRDAQQRLHRRHRERTTRAGSARFWLLVLVLTATAVLVTVAMFRALYIVMG